MSYNLFDAVFYHNQITTITLNPECRDLQCVSYNISSYITKYDNRALAHPLTLDLVLAVGMKHPEYLLAVHVPELSVEARVDHVYVRDLKHYLLELPTQKLPPSHICYREFIEGIECLDFVFFVRE